MSLNEFYGMDMGILKLFLLLYADDIVLFAESECSLQNGLEIRFSYCEKWKLSTFENILAKYEIAYDEQFLLWAPCFKL